MVRECLVWSQLCFHTAPRGTSASQEFYLPSLGQEALGSEAGAQQLLQESLGAFWSRDPHLSAPACAWDVCQCLTYTQENFKHTI